MPIIMKRRDTLLRLERAAMRWYEKEKLFGDRWQGPARALFVACAAHAAAKEKRGRGK